MLIQSYIDVYVKSGLFTIAAKLMLSCVSFISFIIYHNRGFVPIELRASRFDLLFDALPIPSIPYALIYGTEKTPSLAKRKIAPPAYLQCFSYISCFRSDCFLVQSFSSGGTLFLRRLAVGRSRDRAMCRRPMEHREARHVTGPRDERAEGSAVRRVPGKTLITYYAVLL